MIDFLISSPAIILKQFTRSLAEGLPAWMRAALSFWRPLQFVQIDQFFEKQLADVTVLGKRDVHLLLGGATAVKHSFEIPKTNTRDIRRLVEVEAERIYPISLSRLALAWRICASDDQQRLTIEVFGVRKATLEKIDSLAQKYGLPLCRLSVLDVETGAQVEMPLKSIKSQELSLKLGIVTLVAIAFFLTVLTPGIYLSRLSEEENALDRAINSARSSTSAVTTLQRQMRSMQSLAAQVHNQRIRGQVSDVLAQLAEASPDDVVVAEFRLDRERLYLSGRAAAPEEWVIAFAEHEAFQDVSLTSVTRSSAGTSQRFEMRASVRWPEERQEIP